MDKPYCEISFRVKHPSLDLAIVGEKLGMAPFRIWKAGEERQTPKARKLEGKYGDSYCCIRLEKSNDESVALQMKSFLSKLIQHKKLFSDLTSSGGILSFYVFCSGAQSFLEEFDLVLLSQLSELQISVGIEITESIKVVDNK